MHTTQTTQTRATPQPLPENVTSTQPGSGVCCKLEAAWGRLRRGWLKRFRPEYVRRMAERRHGSCEGAPHEVLDPRDLKFCRNQCECYWDSADDPFRWRDRLPFARWGLAEIQLFGWPLLALAIGLGLWRWYAALVPAVLLVFVISFFRDPKRAIPQEEGLLVAPADGKVVDIGRLEHDEFVGGPAVRIGIFLSIFNVHINRAPSASRVIALEYHPGKFLNALSPASARDNEAMWIALEEEAPPHRRMVVRQISGAIARRIVCDLRPGEVLDRGQKFGMIKFGSRTELIIPDVEGLTIDVALGQKIKAGTTIMARYTGSTRRQT